MHQAQNIHGSPNSVNLHWWILLGVYTLLRLWLVADVELGKDEAVYWYWGQHLDASYALLPFAMLKLAHALIPHQEWFLRLPSILLGTLSTALLYRLCTIQGLAECTARWAAAAFALSHWTWHTSSYLHPDGLLVPCWLLALYLARQAETTRELRSYVLMGIASGCVVLCKYSGAFLVGGLGLWIFFTQLDKERWRLLAAFLLPAFAVTSPLIHAQLSTGFYLPQTLSTLSRIEDLTNPLSRLFFFAVNPLFFASPFLLFLLYKGLAHAAKKRDLLSLLPALCTIGVFLFFALYRGQIKGNWILPGLLSLWPVAFALQPKRWLLVAVVTTGLLQATTIGIGLKYPGLYSAIAERSGLDQTYVGLVSKADQEREPSYSWNERLCEYSGWQQFAVDFEEMLRQEKIDLPLPLVSTQYSISFTMAYYGVTERKYYTVDDPRFRDLTDFSAGVGSDYPEEILYVVRKSGLVAESLRNPYLTQELVAELSRNYSGCSPVFYQVFLLRNFTRPSTTKTQPGENVRR